MKKGYDLILTQKDRQGENECSSKAFPYAGPKSWERGHFNPCQKWKNGAFMAQPWHVIFSWQALLDPSPFRPQTMPSTEKKNLSSFFFWDNITGWSRLSRALQHPYLGFINKTQEIDKCQQVLVERISRTQVLRVKSQFAVKLREPVNTIFLKIEVENQKWGESMSQNVSKYLSSVLRYCLSFRSELGRLDEVGQCFSHA